MSAISGRIPRSRQPPLNSLQPLPRMALSCCASHSNAIRSIIRGREVLGAPSSVCEGGLLGFAGAFLNGVNGNQARFSFLIKQITTPRPILRTTYQLTRHWITVHVIKLLAFLAVTVDVKIVKPRLPKLPELLRDFRNRQGSLCHFVAQFARDTLLQHLQHRRRSPLCGLAEQQVNMLRHEDITDQGEFILATNAGKFLNEKIFSAYRLQKGEPTITAESDEVQMATTVIALQPFRHRRTQEPTLTNREWGTPLHITLVNFLRFADTTKNKSLTRSTCPAKYSLC